MSAGLAFFQLLRLASPALPVGAYSYSQGLESAIDAGLVGDGAAAIRWLGGLLEGPVATFEAPLVARAWRAAAAGDGEALGRLNAELLASRETQELRLETCQMGYSLRALLEALPEGRSVTWPACAADALSYPIAYALAARAFGLDAERAVGAWLYGWLENQLVVLMKALPLGSTAAQQALSALLPALARAAARASILGEHEVSNFAPMLGWVAARHETQYSRLFRS